MQAGGYSRLYTIEMTHKVISDFPGNGSFIREECETLQRCKTLNEPEWLWVGPRTAEGVRKLGAHYDGPRPITEGGTESPGAEGFTGEDP